MARKIAINMLLWTDDPADPVHYPLYERLAGMGFDGVELPIFDTDPSRFRELGTFLGSLGLERTATTALDELHNPASFDRAVRDAALSRLRGVIDCCEAVGSTLLGGPLYAALGHFTGQGPTNDELAQSADVIGSTADYAASKGIVLALEFLNRFETYLLNTAEGTADYLERVARPNVVIHYDSFHAHIEERDVYGVIKSHAQHLGHIHISESDRGTPGTGQVAWSDTFRALAEIGYDGWYTIEAFGQSLPAIAAATKIWRPLFESEEQLAADGLKFIRSSI